MIDLSGKTALVTGGSRGIGRACCLVMAKAGADVVIGYRKAARAADSLVQELQQQGREALAVAGDLGRPEAVDELFEATLSKFGSIEIVVGNAGIWKRAAIDQMSEGDWRETLDSNLSSIIYTCRAAAVQMKRQGGGRMVLISSTAGQRGEAYHSHYAATKGAIIALTKSLAAELGPSGIYVNAVAPGWVDTDMAASALADEAQKKKILSDIPLGRIPTPEDIAGVVLFLTSSLANHIQGEVINVNGGSVLCG